MTYFFKAVTSLVTWSMAKSASASKPTLYLSKGSLIKHLDLLFRLPCVAAAVAAGFMLLHWPFQYHFLN